MKLKPGDVVGHVIYDDFTGEFLGLERSGDRVFAVTVGYVYGRWIIERWFPKNLYKIGVL